MMAPREILKLTFEEFCVQYCLGSFSRKSLAEIALCSNNPNILTVLSRSDDADVRWWTVKNNITPMSVLRVMANDRVFSIRSIARNAIAPLTSKKAWTGIWS